MRVSEVNSFYDSACSCIVSCTSKNETLLANDRIETTKLKIGAYDTDPVFVEAVIKVQSGREDKLTPDEASKLARYKVGTSLNNDKDEEMLETPGTLFQQMARKHEKKKRLTEDLSKSAYDPAIKYCIVGSAAESERVWSMAGHVMTESRSSLSPLCFELIMYLKYNSRLWGLVDVVEANKRRRNDSATAKKRITIQNERLDWWRKEISEWDDEWVKVNGHEKQKGEELLDSEDEEED